MLEPLTNVLLLPDSCTYPVGKSVQNTEALSMSLAVLSQPVDYVRVEPRSINSPYNKLSHTVELIA